MDQEKIQIKLNQEAKRISEELNNAPVVVIVAGLAKAGVNRCFTGSFNLGEGREGRLRDLLGILEVAKQIETLNHFSKTRIDGK